MMTSTELWPTLPRRNKSSILEQIKGVVKQLETIC